MGELFGGILKPGEAGMAALRLELERRRKVRWDLFPAPPYVYRSGADLCLRHGESFIGRVCPEPYRQHVGANGHCYLNAMLACQADPELRYFEGYYSWGKGFRWASHGWCVAPDGGVVELSVETWRLDEYHDVGGGGILPTERWAYYGVEFDVELVHWHALDPSGPEELPMLDRSREEQTDPAALSRGWQMEQGHDFPVLKVPYDLGRKSL